MGANFSETWGQIKDIILKTLISVEPSIMTNVSKNQNTRGNCFELYGFDVMIDADLKPWVLEVNVQPSLSSSSAFDKKIKTMVVCDLLTLVGIQAYDKLAFNSKSLSEQNLAPF